MNPKFAPGQRNADTRAIITGGAQGLGFAIAEMLAAEGATRMALAGRDAAKGARAVAALKEQGVEATFIAGDVTSVESCRDIVARGVAFLGTANALVNAAAYCGRGHLPDVTAEEWGMQMDTNARGPLFTMQAFIAAAKAAGHPASIVNILSMVAHGGPPKLIAYSASKAALGNMTKSVAHAFRKDRIRVNGINIGWMDTPAEHITQTTWDKAPENWLELAEARMPFGQLIKPQEVAGLVSYLVSPASGVMTGAIIDHDQNVIGGMD